MFGGEEKFMLHIVRPNESLSSIARQFYGDHTKWVEIAKDNRISNPDLIIVGQFIILRDDKVLSQKLNTQSKSTNYSHPLLLRPGEHNSVIPANNYLFILADEIDPFRKKVVRRVLVNPRMAAEAAKNLGRPLPVFPNPERYGFTPTAGNSPLSIGRHAMGMKPSPFQSASNSLLGARRFSGSSFWIDVEKAKKAGATIHETNEIIADLDRIAAKTKLNSDIERINAIKKMVTADREVLLKGNIPSSAVKSSASMAMTRGLQGVQIVGFAMTAVDLTHATQKSVQQKSIKPIAAETVRQVGGWASAWAGMKIGAAGGALVGIETGPGAIVTGFIGGVAGGVAGYYGFDWIADHIDEN
jgi:hypothetical protein